jgi:hypothetical protein
MCFRQKMKAAKRSSSIALGRTENLLSSREKVAIDIPNEETRHLLEYQVTICLSLRRPSVGASGDHLLESQVNICWSIR